MPACLFPPLSLPPACPQALKKATYKAAAFYKGLLLPLCASGTCNLREAVIFTSVIRRTSIPVLHSAAAMLRIAGKQQAGGRRLEPLLDAARCG